MNRFHTASYFSKCTRIINKFVIIFFKKFLFLAMGLTILLNSRKTLFSGQIPLKKNNSLVKYNSQKIVGKDKKTLFVEFCSE
jgi:hypothetical protein